MRPTWDEWFLELASFVAGRSKDPSTKVGAVVARSDLTIASIGYNGFPRNVNDEPERLFNRPWKYAATVHAELNAILNAREPLSGYTLYVTPLHPCSNCSAAIVQSGIRRVVARMPDEPERWREDFRMAEVILKEGGVEVVVLRSGGGGR